MAIVTKSATSSVTIQYDQYKTKYYKIHFQVLNHKNNCLQSNSYQKLELSFRLLNQTFLSYTNVKHHLNKISKKKILKLYDKVLLIKADFE